MRPRPFGVVVIVVFELFNGITFLLATTATVPGLGEGGLVTLAGYGDLARDSAAVIAVLAIIGAIGLWFLSKRAWVLTMVLVGVALVFGLYSWWLGEPNFPRLLLNAIIAFYLNQPAVQE